MSSQWADIIQEELDARFTLTTSHKYTPDWRGLLVLEKWGKYQCPSPIQEKWKEFVDDVRIDIYGMSALTQN